MCILLDTSGSMGPYLQQVKTELTLLIWEQLRKHCDRYEAGVREGGSQKLQGVVPEASLARTPSPSPVPKGLEASG